MVYLIRWFYNCFRSKYRLRKYPSEGALMYKHWSLYGGETKAQSSEELPNKGLLWQQVDSE